jgi:PHP family Zn ribbon phosphoesterase
VFDPLVERFGSEFTVMLDADELEITRIAGAEISSAIIKTRNQEIEVTPGYDGVYGVPRFEKMKKTTETKPKTSKETKKDALHMQEYLQSHQD